MEWNGMVCKIRKLNGLEDQKVEWFGIVQNEIK